MKSLSITELEISEPESKSETEKKSTSCTSVISIEVVLKVGSSTTIVKNAEEGTNGSISVSWCTSKNLVNVCSVVWIHVPVVGEVFDGFNSLDFSEHFLV